MGIELNLNIFETNLINLSIVLSVVFLVIGDAFKSALSERKNCLLYTSPSPRDVEESRMPSSA